MNKHLIIILLLLCPLLSVGQISFVRHHITGAHAHMTSRPYELSNGNFVCSILHGQNNVWFNVLYLFSACGDLVSTLRVSAPEEYVFVNNFFQLDEHTMLATGLFANPNWYTVYLILDIHTLDVIAERRYGETSLHTIDATYGEHGILTQFGYAGSRIVASRLNTELSRNLHVHMIYSDYEYRDLFSMQPFAASEHRMYSLELYRDNDSKYYGNLRCLDHKLREVYLIRGYGDSIYTEFTGPVALGGDTILTGATVSERFGTGYQQYVRQYVRDALVYERPVDGFDHFFNYSACRRLGDIVRCIDYDGRVAEFNMLGEELYASTHLVPLLNEGDMGGAITTRDNGIFSVRARYLQLDGQWHDVLRIIRTTADYQVSDTPAPECIVSTSDPAATPAIVVYPNPSGGHIRITSTEPILAYHVFSPLSERILSGTGTPSTVDLALDLSPGLYLVHVQTVRGWAVQKVLVVRGE